MAKRLDLEKRIRLETLLKLPFNDGFAIMETPKKLPIIAKLLEVSLTTIYREVKWRGFSYDDYNAKLAHADSLRKVANGNTHYIYSKEQQALILDIFKSNATEKGWSPNALCIRLKRELPADLKIPSVELIYQWIYEDSRGGGTLYALLLRKHKKRKPMLKHREQKITDKVSIHQRSASVEERGRIGDLEIDSIVGPANKPGMVTVTERKSRFNMAALVDSKSGDTTLRKLLELLLKHKKRIKTITSDNGVEFAQHLAIASTLNAMYYFADPYSSYQRGSNENANGMLRRFFPKGTDFTTVSEKELQNALNKINHLPRKIHNGKTAHEIYYGISRSLIPAKQRNRLVFAFRA
jgi:IS30 family transposase